MIHFIGAGPGAPDLITVRGQKFLSEADVIIYAGSLVNPELLQMAKKSCKIHDSAYMTLEEVLEVMEEAEKEGLTTVRLHTGDPSVYGAIREQMEELEKRGIAYDVTPGVSSFCGAAAALGMEYTLPCISQSVILTRMEGRTGVPEKESVESFAAHQATMVLFLSSSMIGELAKRLVDGGYTPQTPAAIVYKATWPEEKVFVCTVGSLEKTAAENGITRTALIIVGEAVRYNGLRGGGGSAGNTGPTGNTGLRGGGGSAGNTGPTCNTGLYGSGGSAGNSGFERSKLYDADFTTGYRIRRPQE